MSFLNKYRGALGLEDENLDKDLETEQDEEQVEEQSEDQVEDQVEETSEQVEEQTEERIDETTEEAIQLDDSETPAAGGSRLQAYREAAGEVEAEDEADKEETETPTDTVEETSEETSEDKEEQSDEKSEGEEEKSEEDSEEEKETPSDEEGDESVKALEALRDEIMVSYQRGGMTEGEASMVNVAVNNILTRNGLEAERVVPSIESFSENSTRRRLATSTTADMINRIISKIKK